MRDSVFGGARCARMIALSGAYAIMFGGAYDAACGAYDVARSAALGGPVTGEIENINKTFEEKTLNYEIRGSELYLENKHFDGPLQNNIKN